MDSRAPFRSEMLCRACGLSLALAGAGANAAGVPTDDLEQVIVLGKKHGLIGQVDSASRGIVLSDQIENRPISRPGELLEVVPGLIVTQHSGDGKANQYFLRGFNLDHGTDFATRVDDVPVNMPTHAHGQGYSDINFLIPEVVESIEYMKGPYYASEGNFSAAGAAAIHYRRWIDTSFVELGAGPDEYRRSLLVTSWTANDNDLLVALEYSHADGPWVLPQGFRKLSGLLKLSKGTSDNGFSVEAMAYDGRWHSTDQIPQRAVADGTISRFGYIDPSDGGSTHRYSLSANWWRQVGDSTWRANSYAIDDGLDLVSDFTYALDQNNGDQFEQFDNRQVFGGSVDYSSLVAIGSFKGKFSAGLQMRNDDIDPVALYLTTARLRRETVRSDQVAQTSVSVCTSYDLRWTEWLRTEVGARFDHYDFKVDSSLPVNSGSAHDNLVSPKLAMVFGPWNETEFFANIGQGFHSNDARGTTIRVDPSDGVTPTEQVEPLVRALGAEVGMRTAVVPKLQLATSLWTIELDSELLFIGDAGATEASRGSRRTGLEIGAFYSPLSSLVIDADVALSRARFKGNDIAGNYIPGAVARVASIGVAINHPTGWFGGVRARFFGDIPLIEDDSVHAGSTLLINVEAGYQFSKNLRLGAMVLNLFDRQGNDITYYYESQLPGEAAPVDDIHFHPVEPRTFRVALRLSY